MLHVLVGLISLLLIGCASSHQPIPDGAEPHLDWPVQKARLTQKSKKGHKKHQGIDLAAKTNTPIYAAERGKVIYTGRDFSGYGKLVIIEHQGDRWASFYAHLNAFSVREGQYVRKGQRIGLMGRTGRATGTHLHFEIRYKRKPIDPLRVLPKQVFLGSR